MMSKLESTAEEPAITSPTPVVLKSPVDSDGPAVFALIEKCPPLDTNSRYCNLLQCLHFADTSMGAYLDDKLVGFVSGYLPPTQSNTLFIWQVAIDESMRGQGLGGRLIKQILQKAQHDNVQFLETTITMENKASWALFEKLAKQLGANVDKSPLFTKDIHFSGLHDTEMLMRIGPFNSSTL